MAALYIRVPSSRYPKTRAISGDSAVRIRRYTCAAALILSISGLSITGKASVDQVRDALARKDDDTDNAKALEEAFRAAEKSCILLKEGGRALTYGFDHALVCDQRLTLVPLAKTSGGT